MILNGKIVSKSILQDIKNNIVKYKINPKLIIIQLGDLKESNLYIKNKIRIGQEIGINIELIKITEEIELKELILLVDKFNKDDKVHGIIVQLPIKNELKDIVKHIDATKDVDGLGKVQQSNLLQEAEEKNVFYPCTALAVIKILEYYKLDVEGKNCLIIGRSNLVGKPLSLLLLKKNAAITVVHSKITNLEKYVENADFIFLAVGRKNIFNFSLLKSEQVVVDIGINIENGELSGDLDKNMYEKLETYTPVPGGVGPMTVAMLMYNVYLSAIDKKIDKKK